MPTSNTLLTTAIQRNAREKLYVVAILLFYVLQKYLFKKGCLFSEDYCHITFNSTSLIGASISP
jgi:hypothetical protein